MFDQRGITLNDVIRTVATYEGAHSINVSRVQKDETNQAQGPFRHPERHILDIVTVFGMKHTDIVVIECALYLYGMLVEGGHIERLDDKERGLIRSFMTFEQDGYLGGDNFDLTNYRPSSGTHRMDAFLAISSGMPMSNWLFRNSVSQPPGPQASHGSA